MWGGCELRRNEGSRVCAAVGFDRRDANDASQFDFELDGAVEIEIPAESLLIVAHGMNTADDEPS